jgi:hypothetical protein
MYTLDSTVLAVKATTNQTTLYAMGRLQNFFFFFFLLKYQGNIVQKTECSLKCEKLYFYNIVMERKNGLVLLKNGEIMVYVVSSV